MKKKLMLSMVSTLIFSMIIATLLFIVIENREYIKNMKDTLKLNNEIIMNIMKNEKIEDKSSFLKKIFSNEIMRVTLIDKNGKVLGDSMAEEYTMSNHNWRKEVQEARKYGTGI